MSESADNNPEAEILNRIQMQLEDLDDPVTLVERIYQIWWHWADFHLHVITPHIDTFSPPIIIEAELISADEKEFVYPIQDRGDKLSTSKGEDMFCAGKSNCKLFFTIEKMISILIDRLKAGGIDMDTEVQVAFSGHQLAQRKAFESIINLNYNVVVTNFDPGVWGENYLQNVKRVADKGFGYPSETPRQPYKQLYASNAAGIKR